MPSFGVRPRRGSQDETKKMSIPQLSLHRKQNNYSHCRASFERSIQRYEFSVFFFIPSMVGASVNFHISFDATAAIERSQKSHTWVKWPDSDYICLVKIEELCSFTTVYGVVDYHLHLFVCFFLRFSSLRLQQTFPQSVDNNDAEWIALFTELSTFFFIIVIYLVYC